MRIKFQWSRTRGIALAFSLAVGAGVAAVRHIVNNMSGKAETRLEVSKNSGNSQDPAGAEPATRRNLRLMTINIAHGRKNGPYQIFQNGDSIVSHLDEIAELASRENPDVLALQEADGPSIWTGGLDQVKYMAQKACFPYYIHGEHVKGMKISYGTALLSRFKLSDSMSFTFEPSPPMLAKGWIIATATPPDRPDMPFDVVSVHLDFSRKSVREKQVDEMIGKLQGRKRPMIIMGDLNCDWASREASLLRLTKELNLKAYLPEAQDLDTFPKLKKRLDWILIPPGLKFVKYRVLPDIISDHYAVLCEVGSIG